jgi:hypothetical protein
MGKQYTTETYAKKLEEMGGGITIAAGQEYVNGSTLMRFVCFCDNEFETMPRYLIRANTEDRVRSCGCLKSRKHKGCESKFTVRSGITRKLNQCRYRATKKQIPFEISTEEALHLMQLQGHRCAITRLPITLDDTNLNTASLDRIDSSGGYVLGNIQWIHKDVNTMKWNFDAGYFVTICKLVTQYN